MLRALIVAYTLVAAHCFYVADSLAQNNNVVLIKVGGSSITNKAIPETLNGSAIEWFSSVVRTALDNGQACVIVHGAGSFGHQTAKAYGLKGQSEPPPQKSEQVIDDDTSASQRDTMAAQALLMQGLAKTRMSVQKLNHALIEAFHKHDVPAVGISPCFGIPDLQAHGGGSSRSSKCPHSTPQQCLLQTVHDTVTAGLVPVLHGDACLYGTTGAGILSGDTVMELLGPASWIRHAVFLTDVDGVYTADPKTDDTAVLLKTLRVDPATGDLLMSREHDTVSATGSTHEHDVTGGLQTKLLSATSIAATGKNVTIVRCGSVSAEKAILGHANDVEVVATVLTSAPSKNSRATRFRAFARMLKARYRSMLFG